MRGGGLDFEGDGTRGDQGGEDDVGAAFLVEGEVYSDFLLGDLDQFLMIHRRRERERERSS